MSYNVFLEKIYNLVDEFPNDQDLGEALRSWYNSNLKPFRCFHEEKVEVEWGDELYDKCIRCEQMFIKK